PCEGEEPVSREEGIGPTVMVGRAPSDAGAFFLLAQDGAQASSDKAVEDAEQGWCGMLEGANHPQSSGLRSLTIRSRRSPRRRLVMLLTLSPAFAGGRLVSAF